MTRRRRERENDLVLKQGHHIHFMLHRKKVAGIVFDLLLRQSLLVVNELQNITHLQRILDTFETTLATQRRNAFNMQKQSRPLPLAHPPLDPIGHAARRIDKRIERSRQGGNRQFALQDPRFARKNQSFNDNPLRHKARMILFLPAEVKAKEASLWIFFIFSICRASSGIFAERPMPSPTIVLASTSPFRRELLNRLKIPFAVADPYTDETARPEEAPEQIALRLSEAKARAVAGQYPEALIIGSDQVAYLDDRIFGKPGNHANAVRQLRAMRGKTVTFFTGLCLLNAATGVARTRGIPTAVTFRDLADDEIENYLDLEQPYRCAGSAKSEGLGIALIAKMEGEDPNALIGLPLIALCDLFRLEGVDIFRRTNRHRR